MHIGINRKKICFLSVLMIVTLLMTALYLPPMTFPSNQNSIKNKKLSLQEILSNYLIFRPNTKLKPQISKNVSTGVFLKGKISAYLPGETIHIFFRNGNNTRITLDYINPWWIKMKKNNTWETVYIPQQKPSNVIIEAGDYMHWTWNQKDNNGRQVPDGEYSVVFKVHKREYSRNFIISHSLGRILDDLLPLILDNSSSLSDEFKVNIIFKTNVTAAMLLFMEQKIGHFNISSLWNNTKVPGISTKLTKAQILCLSEWNEIAYISLNGEGTIFLDTSKSSTHINWAMYYYGLTGDRDGDIHNYSTEDVVIAILDTGINDSHVDLDQNKVYYDIDFTESGNVLDWNGHGTQMASIAAGTGDANPNYVGVAKGATIINVKVIGYIMENGEKTPYYSEENILTALSWVVDNKDIIDVVSISWGNDDFSTIGVYDEVAQKVDEVVSNGIVVVVAAGNFGGNTIPGEVGRIATPGTAKHAITVGAVADPGEGGWYLWYRSSYGPTDDGRIKPDVVAPGVNIMAADASSKTGYYEGTGTSSATAFVAGLVALMLDYDPTLKGDSDGDGDPDVKELLMGSAIDMGAAGKDNYYGSGRIDAREAMYFQDPVYDDGANSRTSATLILEYSGDTWIYDEALWVKDPTDWYRIKAYEDARIYVSCYPREELDVIIQLVDEFGHVIATNNPAIGQQGYIDVWTSRSGEYFILVYCEAGNDWYDLHVIIEWS